MAHPLARLLFCVLGKVNKTFKKKSWYVGCWVWTLASWYTSWHHPWQGLLSLLQCLHTHTCARADTPVGGCRGISNVFSKREREIERKTHTYTHTHAHVHTHTHARYADTTVGACRGMCVCWVCGAWRTHVYVGHDSFMCGTWLMDMHDTRLIHTRVHAADRGLICMRDMTDSYLGHDSFTCVTFKFMSPVTHMNESCHTYEWVLSHTGMSPVTHTNESCHTHEWFMPHT